MVYFFFKIELILHYITCNDIFYLLNGISYTDIPRNLPRVQQEMIVRFLPNVSFSSGEHPVT